MTNFISPQKLREKARFQDVMLLREFPHPEATVLENIPPLYRQWVDSNQRLLAFHSYKAYTLHGRGVITIASSATQPVRPPIGEHQLDLTYTPRRHIRANSGHGLPWVNSLLSPLARDKVDDYRPELQAVIVVLDAIAAVLMIYSFEVTPLDCYSRLNLSVTKAKQSQEVI
ncbi:MAG TPA: hypothetical protein V6D03_13260 [Candidatus Caenarcaniphilales bacterium]